MPTFNIVVFAGDYCGPEVTAEAVKILKVVEKCSKRKGDKQLKFDFQEYLLGGCSIDAHGEPLTDKALSAAKSAHAVLLGAIGGPKYGTGPIRPEQGLLKLRKELGTFGNLRPCSFASPSLTKISPLREEVCKDTDFMIIRELTGGIYFGERKEADPDKEGEDEWAEDREPYSRKEIERITRLAATLAIRDAEKNIDGKPSKVWSLDKANVLATSRLWRRVVTETMANEFPQLELAHQLIDSAAMLMVRNPRALNGVIVTSNLFGDIISDEASVIPGSLGLLPSASLSGIPHQGQDGGEASLCNGIYEPIHGSAPDIAGQGAVNPVAAVLSVAMLLRYSLGMAEEAKLVEEAVRNVIEMGVGTKDIGGSASTSQVGDQIAEELETLLKR
ncbi:hypothetical protein GJ744_007500 [Endocarpon pusillum]|uniref:3-isopropylmalate dehydrogenase n=1 Tax=Endocarpon pusillum TaxID=364733 RepID=A0A8H7AIN6_9EURO|nr:hypothetical protein GJ744_007500 [Endocarpon pusillum]